MMIFRIIVYGFFILMTDGLRRIAEEKPTSGRLIAEMVMQMGHEMLRECHNLLVTAGKPTVFLDDLLR